MDVGFDRFLELVKHIQGISQVVKGWGVLAIELYSLRVGCRCLLVLALYTERIAKVVEGLRLFGVDRDRPLIVSNRLVYFLD